jgi:xanthine dehydrogenase accessory factor
VIRPSFTGRTATRSHSLQQLLPLFERERAAARSMVMATVLRTSGPTYSKPGALMLISDRGEYAGVLSGGCLEGDLLEHSRRVLRDGVAQLISYDMRGPDDLLFGLGSGCEGAMDILLQRLDPQTHWQPMQRLTQAWHAQRPQSLLLIARSTNASWPCGAGMFSDDGVVFGGAMADSGELLSSVRALATRSLQHDSSRYLAQGLPGFDLLALHQAPPVQVLLLGAGPDAQPVAQFAALLGWQVTVIDHRPHYARAARFNGARAVLDTGPAGLRDLLEQVAVAFDAAIIMSHHLATDLAYLRAIADTSIPYVGLLGPIVRRDRLLAQMGPLATRLSGRLRAPVGLDLGAGGPQSIALAIVAELQGTLAGRVNVEPMSHPASDTGTISNPLSGAVHVHNIRAQR